MRTLVSPFSCKDNRGFWLGIAPNLDHTFPYLNLDTSAYAFPMYVTMKANTETDTEVTVMAPDILPPLNPEAAPPMQPKFAYDMTHYMSHPQLRKSDSRLMAHVFTAQWNSFKTDSSKHDFQNYPSIAFKETFHGSRRCLQFLKTPEEIFKYYFKMCDIEMPACINEMLDSSLPIVIPFFSHLKAFIHNNIDRLPPISYCYSELDTIVGYPLEKHRALTDDPVAWLSRDVADKHDPQWWSNNISTLLLRSAIPHRETLISFFEFIKSPWLWVTDGASSVSKLLLRGESVKSKFAAALSLTPNELLASVIHALSPKSVNIDIFIKQDERGFKRRLIANMDLGSYLIAAYIRYLLEWLDGPVPSWMTATTDPNKDREVMELLKLQHQAMPLDESQFDHHLSRNAWKGFLSALDFIFPNNFGVHLFHVLFQNSQFFDRTSGARGPWTKGMPSGLAITSIGNTLFNYIKQQAIISPIHYALGDDVLVFPDGYTVPQVSEYYTTFGAEVNVKKNWISNHYAEYLHFLYCAHGRVGLPARIYGSLMYGLQFKDVTPLQRLNELTQLFKDFYDRAVLQFDTELVAKDLSRAVSRRWAGFSSAVAKQWLHIPKALNGYGFLPYIPFQFTVRNTKVRRDKFENALYPIPDQVSVIDSEWSLRPFKLTDASFHTGNTFRLPEIKTIDDWIDRLNFTVPGIPVSVQKYASEVIPLPEIDFVSTSRMSAFASQWKYNAFPNLGGSIATRTTRFIKASIALAEQVVSWLRRLDIRVYV